MIKTETLTANVEKLVEVKDAYAMIENRGSGTVYASKNPNISAGGDGVLAIDAGNAKVLRNVDGKIYVKSDESGAVEIQTANDLHFFKPGNPSGGGGINPKNLDNIVTEESENAVKSSGIYDYVNSSVSTNTAFYRGNYDSIEALQAYSGDLTNNDYAFVTSVDEDGNTLYNRYKYKSDTEEWIYEYTLNNSSFTAVQWATINSGITADDKTELANKVGFNDYATITKAGVSKVKASNGIELDKDNFLAIVPAYDDYMKNFADDSHPITPYRFKKAMGLFGINSQTQIADMQDEIGNKFGAENFNSEQFTVENNVVSLTGGGGETVDISNEIILSTPENVSSYSAILSPGGIGYFSATTKYNASCKFVFPFIVKFNYTLTSSGTFTTPKISGNSITLSPNGNVIASCGILFFK